MSAADPAHDPVDEFEQIARLFAPLTQGAPEALGLRDDAAVIPSRPGFDLVVTTDTLVEGVHFLPGDPLDLVARKLLRVNLSDLAAKGAEPYGYFLQTSWSARCGWDARAAFAAGLATDQAVFAVRLLGGDTTSTSGPLTVGMTALGWVPAGRTVRRDGARAGDLLLVSGVIGDGVLGLEAATGGLTDLAEAHREALTLRYRLPEPRLSLTQALRAFASASADVSDGLLADAGHIGEASGCAVVIELDRLPLSAPAAAWLERQGDRPAALARLAAGGDDYEIVLAVSPDRAAGLVAAAVAVGQHLTQVGRIEAGQELRVLHAGVEVGIDRTGYRHR